MQQDSASNRWLVAAKLLRPQGRRGEMLAEPHVSFDLFGPGRQLWLATILGASTAEDPQPAETTARVLEGAWEPVGKNAGRVVLKLAGVETISEAEGLNGRSLLMRADDLPALEQDTFRIRDLVGCSLFDGDVLMGRVVDVQFPVGSDGRTRLADAPDLLAVRPGAGHVAEADGDAEDEAETVLIPFVRAWLVDVDTAGKRIAMHLPQGLFGALDSE